MDETVELEEKMRLVVIEDKKNEEKLEVQNTQIKELKEVIDTK